MIIKNNVVLSKSTLLLIAAPGWAVVLFLAWLVDADSLQRSVFALLVAGGASHFANPDAFNARSIEHPWLTLMHTMPGLLFAIPGPPRFMSPLRVRWPPIRRACGTGAEQLKSGVAENAGIRRCRARGQ